jgi:hypothetical protein
LEFLKTYLPKGWYLETGLPSLGDFERNQYDSVVKIIDPQILINILTDIYGDTIKNAESPMDYLNEPVDKKVAYQFVAMHNLVTQRNQLLADNKASETGTNSGEPEA